MAAGERPVTLEGLQHALKSLRENLIEADADIVSLLLARIAAWKLSHETPDELDHMLERVLGHSWFSSDRLHFQVYELVLLFRSKLAALEGMTMNERLVIFDLMERWDRSSEHEREALCAKLHARR
jgi:hypothetical protein